MEDTPREIYPFSSSYGRNSTFWFNDKLDASGHQPEPEEEFATLYDAPVEVVVLLSIFYGGISIIAVIGNTLVIWVVATTRQMHTVTNMYIANLAFADVIIGMFCIPFQFQAALLQRWNLPEFMCAFCPFVQVLSVNVSVFTLTAIAVDRHRAIINPLRARPTRFISKVIITSIWIAAVSFAIPIAIAFRVIQMTEKIRENGIVRNVTRPFCENVNLTDEQLQTYRYYLVFVQYVVPFCVISFVYIQMAVKLWGSRTPGNAQDARDITLLRNKKKVIKMLIIVVVVFGVCWLPLQTYNILHVTWPAVNEYRYINIIWFSCDWLAMSNSCYNPFIYGIYNEKFKREFNKRFSVCFCKFRTNDSVERTMSIYTRASSIRSNYTNSSTRCRNNVLTHAQHHNNGTKVHDGYSAITDLNHHQKDAGHNNLQANKAGKAAFWFRHPTNDTDFHRYIATDCACRILSEDEWDQDRECDGSCLTGGNFINTNNSSSIEQNKNKSIRIVRNCMATNAVNDSGFEKQDEIRKSCMEMDELHLASTGNGKHSVKFNNF